MAGVGESVGAYVGTVLLCACGNYTATEVGVGSSGGSGLAGADSTSGGSGDRAAQGASASGGSAKEGSAADGEAGAGGSAEARDGEEGGRPARQCQWVDGQLSYGPIGEPWPWPLEDVATSIVDCTGCGPTRDFAAFRTDAGYGFVWNTAVDVEAPAPNVFGMVVDANFAGGEPRGLPAVNAAVFLEVAPAQDGYAVMTCSLDSEPEWLSVDGELGVAGAERLNAPDAPCGYEIPRVIWTGERYLTSFTDARGLVLASLDAQGALLGESVLSAEIDSPVSARLSKNGDRVLFALSPSAGQYGEYTVLDVNGTPLGELQPYGAAFDSLVDFAVVTKGDGWWVVSGSGGGTELDAVLTGISRDGVVEQEDGVFGGYYFVPTTLTRSASGRTLLLGSLGEHGRFAHSFSLLALIDDAGEIVYSQQTDAQDQEGPWTVTVVADPERDLVVEERREEGGQRTLVVQEYGCLE